MDELVLATAGMAGREIKQSIGLAESEARERLRGEALAKLAAAAPAAAASGPYVIHWAAAGRLTAVAGGGPVGAVARVTFANTTHSFVVEPDQRWSGVLSLPPGPNTIAAEIAGHVARTELELPASQISAACSEQDFTASLERQGISIPSPAALANVTFAGVAGQHEARKRLLTTAKLHFAGCRQDIDRHERSAAHAVLMLGTAGCGKTALARALARQLAVPFASLDAADLLTARAVDDIPRLAARRLLVAAGGRVDRARYGVLCIQNVDRLCAPDNAWGLQLQHGLLRLCEGEAVTIRAESLGSTERPVRFTTEGVLYVFEARAKAASSRDDTERPRSVSLAQLERLGVAPQLARLLAPSVIRMDELRIEELISVSIEQWEELEARHRSSLLPTGWPVADGLLLDAGAPASSASPRPQRFDDSAWRQVAAHAHDRREGGHGTMASLLRLLHAILCGETGAPIDEAAVHHLLSNRSQDSVQFPYDLAVGDESEARAALLRGDAVPEAATSERQAGEADAHSVVTVSDSREIRANDETQPRSARSAG
jgi:hypothetical protein